MIDGYNEEYVDADGQPERAYTEEPEYPEPEIVVIEQPPLPREGMPPTERTRINLARENRRIT